MEKINDNLDEQGHKLRVQRLVKVWIEDVYHVDEITPEIIDSAIDGDLEADDYDTIWDSMEELGAYEVYNDDGNLIYKRDE